MADKVITVFSPEGRLWQVEYAYKVVKASEITAVGAKCRDAVVVAVEKKVGDKLLDPSTVTHMFRVTDLCGACLVGFQPDVHNVVIRLRQAAYTFQRKNGFSIPVPILAARLAEYHQLASQHGGIRPLAVAAILFGMDANGPQLYRVEPSGFSSGFVAVAAGKREVEGASTLEKKWRVLGSVQECEEFVLNALQSIVGSDFEANDVEVVCYQRDTKKFSLVSREHVDDVLRAVADRD